MFTRADELWLEEREGRFPLHVLEFYWDGFEPGLHCYDSAKDGVEEFDLEDVRFAVSKRKTCIGYFDGDMYIKCPDNSPVTTFGQCEKCSGESFIPYQECVFDPKCDGELCDIAFCKRRHVLYLAFYDTHTKIGMSSTKRVEKRLVEQGADAFSIIGSWDTRKKAREAEKQLSAKLRIPQAFRQEFLLQNLSRPVDGKGIEARFEGLKRTMSEAHHLELEPLQWLDKYPIDLPLRKAPKLQDTWGMHRGDFVGIKGKWLIYESGDIKALSLSDLPARYVSRDEF